MRNEVTTTETTEFTANQVNFITATETGTEKEQLSAFLKMMGIKETV